MKLTKKWGKCCKELSESVSSQPETISSSRTMYKMSALSSRKLWRLCRSLLHIGLLVLSLPELCNSQFSPGTSFLNRFGAQLNRAKQPSHSSLDSFGSAINVFNMTTISPPFDYETATKVSAETIDAILGALDNAAQTIENAQVCNKLRGIHK